MNVCGLLIHMPPDNTDQIRSEITAIEGVEVHGDAGPGRLIVTVEDTADSLAIDTVSIICQLDGISSVALVYHEMEPAEAA